MQVVRDADVTDPSSFYKITACRNCGRVRQVAKESGICGKCAKKIVEGVFRFLSCWR